MAKKLDLSIVISTLGFESLYKTVESVVEHRGKYNIEILIIGKLGKEMEEKFKKNKLIKLFSVQFDKGDLSCKRNFGMEKARSEIVAHIDDDVAIGSDWFEKGLRHFKDSKVGLVSGPGLVPQKEVGFLTKMLGNTMASLGAGPVRKRYVSKGKLESDECGDKIIGCNMLIRKRVFEEIRGFDTEIIPAEENDFANRAIKKGWKVLMDPEFNLIHYARSSIRKFIKQIFRFGKAKINSMRRGAQPVKSQYFLPLLAVLGFPILVILSFMNSWIAELFFVFVMLYFYFVLFCSLVSIFENKKFSNIFLLLTIPLLHFSYGLGELYEAVIGGLING